MTRLIRVVLTLAIVVVAWAGLTGGGRVDAQSRPGSGPADARARLGAAVDPAIAALWPAYDMKRAMDHVRFIAQYWRLPGNRGYNASIDHIFHRVAAAGLTATIEEYPTSGQAWEYSVGTLALVNAGKRDQIVLSKDKDHIALCINSFGTAPGGVVAPLVDVGRGTAQDYAGKDLKGAVVLGDQSPGQLWSRAVVTGGAIGVISASPPPGYINPDAPGARVTPRDQWDIFQWTTVPYDEARKAFGFKASARAATTLRKRLKEAGTAPVSVRVTIASSFTTGPARTLMAEIPGRTAAAERIVLAAHVQEPGANDNASGVATLAETAAALATAIRQKKIAPPERTLTFLFLTEISGSRRWLQDHPDLAKQVRYMFSLDMTGEDVRKTGGSFLIERYPDPGSVWTRPWDPHTEWGAGNVRAESLKGDLINDAHLFVVQRVARRTGWVVKTNPYEGGSDHTVFQGAGVPSVLDWHFTDRYYHTNFDTPDKTSPEEMRNVGVSVGASAWLLASATPAIALDVAEVVAAAGRDRIAVEMSEGARLAAAAADPAAARTRETTIVSAWKKWYAEAVRSAARLVVGAAPASFGAEIERIASAFTVPASAGSGSGRVAAATAAAWFDLASASFEVAQTAEDRPTIFRCGEDQRLPSPIPLHWTTLVLAGDGRLYTPCLLATHTADHREVRELDLLERGAKSFNPEERWRTVQAEVRMAGSIGGVLSRPYRSTFLPACNAEAQFFGNFENSRRWQPGMAFQLLRNGSIAVRKEAAYALGVQLSRPNLDSELMTAAIKELHVCWLTQSDPEVQGLLLEAVGVARYPELDQALEAQAFLVKESRGLPPKVLGAVKGFEALFRQNPQLPVSDEARLRLRELVNSGVRPANAPILDLTLRTKRVALMALQAARDTDALTIETAATDPDWQMRRLVAGRLNLSDAAQAQLGGRLAGDEAFQVRYELLGPLARQATRTGACEPIVRYFKDPSPTVVMRAMDVLVATCTDLEEVTATLTGMADSLKRPEDLVDWHFPSRALATLARITPELAKPRLAAAAKYPVWQVRAAAAALSVSLANEAVAMTLVADREPNVRTAALEALSRMKSSAAVPEAIDALRTGTDHQLLRTAALSLKGLPEEAKANATQALLDALRRLTDQQADTSRDPRVAILDRLAETMGPDRSSELTTFATDYDNEVRAAAVRAFAAIVGAPPFVLDKWGRYPFQPTQEALSNLPTQATIRLDGGSVILQLLPDVAPVTIARFAALANSGFYNNRTFHRVVPNFVVQGGSPGANEYSGTSRYLRDEVGPQAVHVRGAVGISSRGGDTGDGQIFIDLVDLPRLDRDYTVFAYVKQGMEFVDRLLDGATIVNILVK